MTMLEDEVAREAFKKFYQEVDWGDGPTPTVYTHTPHPEQQPTPDPDEQARLAAYAAADRVLYPYGKQEPQPEGREPPWGNKMAAFLGVMGALLFTVAALYDPDKAEGSLILLAVFGIPMSLMFFISWVNTTFPTHSSTRHANSDVYNFVKGRTLFDFVFQRR